VARWSGVFAYRRHCPLVSANVTPILTQMAERHPRLEMDVSYSDRMVDLIGERFDAAIRIGSSGLEPHSRRIRSRQVRVCRES